MKYLGPIFIFIFVSTFSFGQDKVSEIEQIISPEYLAYSTSLKYIEHGSNQYALFSNKEYLELYDINDLDGPVKRYKIQLECFNFLEENNELVIVNDNIYLVRDTKIQEINLSESGQTSVFDFNELTGPWDEFIVGGHSLVGFQPMSNELKVEVINLEDKSNTVLTFGDYNFVRNVNDNLIAISDDKDEILLLHLDSGSTTTLHQGENLVLSVNLSRSKNEVVFIDNQQDVYAVDLESMQKELICTIDGHSSIFFVYNSEDYIYYSAFPEGITERMFFGVSKVDCEVKYSKVSDDASVIGHYSSEDRVYSVVKSFQSLDIIEERVQEVFNNGYPFTNSTTIKIIDDKLYALGRDTSSYDLYRLDEFDFTTQSFSHDVNTITEPYSMADIGKNGEDGLIILTQVDDVSSVIRYSLEADSIITEPFLRNYDSGLRPRSDWKKHGQSISSGINFYSDELVFFNEDETKKISQPTFFEGAYKWDDKIAGIVEKQFELYFTIYDVKTETIIDEILIGPDDLLDRHPIYKIGDDFYELKYDYLRKRYPVVSNEPAFEETFVGSVRVQADSKVIAWARNDENNKSNLFLISEDGVEPILTDLPSSDYYQIDIETDTKTYRSMFFYDKDNDETQLISFDVETGALLMDTKLKGKRRYHYHNSGIMGWKTIVFQTSNGTEYTVSSNGKEVRVFGIDSLGLNPKSNVVRRFAKDKLFLVDEDLNIVSVNEPGDIITSSGTLKFESVLYDVLYENGKYYFITYNWDGFKLIQTNENLETEAVLLRDRGDYCAWGDPEFLGVGPGSKGNIYFTFSTQENGLEVWFIDQISNEALLLKDINGLASGSYESKEFYHDGAVYFKASDELGNVQLYKIPLASQTVNTEELQTSVLGLNIYPNPTDNRINFDLPLNNIVIRDVTGKIVRSEILRTGIKTLRVNDFKPGIYFLEGYDVEGNKYIQKFIKI